MSSFSESYSSLTIEEGTHGFEASISSKCRCSLVSGNQGNTFRIENHATRGATLHLNNQLDRETRDRYILVVKAIAEGV